jgi:hypothetical protein
MPKRRNFIEREVFENIIAGVPRKDGSPYADIDTIYGDMSRLVVGWLSKAKPEELRRLYNQLEWGGTANARAMIEAAKAWMKEHRSDTQ